MRIDGMDASTMVIDNSTKSNHITKELKAQIRDMKNISQMTDFDKREMPLSDKVVIEAIERANKAIFGTYRQFEFSIHEQTKQIMIKVINSETKEIVREIPPEKILDMVAKMWEMAGIIVDERR